MGLQKNFEDLKAFDEGVTEYLKSSNKNSLAESSIQKILHLIHVNNYLQVLYSYGIEVMSDLLTYFLSIENYHQCIRIRDCIFNHNKSTGDQLKLIF